MMGCEWDRTAASLTKAKHLYYGRSWPMDTTPEAQQKLDKDDAAVSDANACSPDSACLPKRARPKRARPKRAEEFAKEQGLPRLTASNAGAYPPTGIKLTACKYRKYRGADGVYDVASDSRAALWYWQVRAAHEQPPSRLMSSSSGALTDDG